MNTSSEISRLITLGTRSSLLSRAQVRELQVLVELKRLPIRLCPIYIETIGDRDQTTSLRDLDKTDFFTRDIDEFQLARGCRLALHSAKDLPDPLPSGLHLVALTEADSRDDVLVFRQGESLQSLPSGAVVGTSSARREEAVKRLRDDLSFVDIRGSVPERISQLESHQFDAVVIAEAAILRLGLTHLPRITIPGEVAPFQGQLALLARTDDLEARLLFTSLDSRKGRRILYLGLDPSRLPHESIKARIFHYPVIRVDWRSPESDDIQAALAALGKITHLLFTSKVAVQRFFSIVDASLCKLKEIICVGEVTAHFVKQAGLQATHIAEEETAEGLMDVLEECNLDHAFCLWPHGNLSRRLISDYLSVREVPYLECILYDTLMHRPFDPPPLEAIDELIFTSPSTVDGFLSLYDSLPADKQLTAQGPVTWRYLQRQLDLA